MKHKRMWESSRCTDPLACYPNHLPCPSPTQYTHLSAQITLLRIPWSWRLESPPTTSNQIQIYMVSHLRIF